MKPNLKARAIRASMWSIGGKFAAQGLRLASNLVMTRLLAPDMFGVMAMGLVFLTAIQMFSDVGLRQVVIKSGRGEQPDFLNTVWSVQIVRGAVLAAICMAVAGGLGLLSSQGMLGTANVYGHPQLPWVLGLLSLSAVISGFESTKRLTANRKLALGRIVAIELAAQALAFVPMLLVATWYPSVFALVSGAIVSALLQVVFGHLFLPGSPNRWAWHASALDEIRGFGRWILVTSALGFLLRLGDRVVLGALVSAPVMGMYAIACIMAGVPQQLAERLIHSIALPVFSEIQRTSPGQLRATYYRMRLPIDAMCLGAAGLLLVAAESIIAVLYDHRYAGAGPMLQALAMPLVAARYGLAGQFYLVLDRPKLMAQLQGLRLTCLMAFIPLGHALGGVQGAIWGVALAPLPEVVVALAWVQRRLGLVNYTKELLLSLWLLPGLAAGWGLDSLIKALGLAKGGI